MVHIIFFILLYLYCTISSVANAALNVIDISSSHKNISQYISVYKDSTHAMKLSDLRKLDTKMFIPLMQATSSYGSTHTAYWYKFDVWNKEDSKLSRLMVFEPEWLDYIDVSIISPVGEIEHYQYRNRVPYCNRVFEHHFLYFKALFDAGVSEVYVKIETQNSFNMSVSLMDAYDFFKDNIFYLFYIGIFYGAIIILIIYHFLLYFSLKKSYYRWYLLYLFSFLLLSVAYNGYLFQFKFPYFFMIQKWIQPIFLYLLSVVSLFFALSFLNVKKYQPILFKWIYFFIYMIVFVYFFSALFVGYDYTNIFGIVFVVLGHICMVSIAVYVWIKNNRSARFFLFGSMSGMIGIIIAMLTVKSFIPYTYIGYQAIDFGMLIEILFFSLALADRYKITQEIKLKVLQEEKTDRVTGLKNRRSFYEVSALESRKLKRYKNDFSIIVLNIDNFKKVNEVHGHSMGDLLLKQIAFSIRDTIRMHDYIFRLSGDEFIILLPETKEEDAYVLAQRIKEKINSIYLKETERQVMGVSMGISSFKPKDEDIHDIIKRADNALNDVKLADKNNIKVWEENHEKDQK